MPVTDTAHVQPARRGPVAVAAYFRRLPGMDREDVHQTVKELVVFAEQQGLVLVAAHCEESPSERLATWAALITGCRAAGITQIVVPGPQHFHHDAGIAAFMREELAEKIRGAVRYTSDTTNTETGRP
ncbi:hypothetical protein [Streptomyces sp. NPDC021020]|uniref:hypothetical protein n=1 Tax=Streptomyces sp. NPDC021020 TaxID=3365109 RepID=UPI00378C61EE